MDSIKHKIIALSIGILGSVFFGCDRKNESTGGGNTVIEDLEKHLINTDSTIRQEAEDLAQGKHVDLTANTAEHKKHVKQVKQDVTPKVSDGFFEKLNQIGQNIRNVGDTLRGLKEKENLSPEDKQKIKECENQLIDLMDEFQNEYLNLFDDLTRFVQQDKSILDEALNEICDDNSKDAKKLKVLIETINEILYTLELFQKQPMLCINLGKRKHFMGHLPMMLAAFAGARLLVAKIEREINCLLKDEVVKRLEKLRGNGEYASLVSKLEGCIKRLKEHYKDDKSDFLSKLYQAICGKFRDMIQAETGVSIDLFPIVEEILDMDPASDDYRNARAAFYSLCTYLGAYGIFGTKTNRRDLANPAAAVNGEAYNNLKKLIAKISDQNLQNRINQALQTFHAGYQQCFEHIAQFMRTNGSNGVQDLDIKWGIVIDKKQSYGPTVLSFPCLHRVWVWIEKNDAEAKNLLSCIAIDNPKKGKSSISLQEAALHQLPASIDLTNTIVKLVSHCMKEAPHYGAKGDGKHGRVPLTQNDEVKGSPGDKKGKSSRKIYKADKEKCEKILRDMDKSKKQAIFEEIGTNKYTTSTTKLGKALTQGLTPEASATEEMTAAM